jgi:DNA-binding CsgD family transcriptional regulator
MIYSNIALNNQYIFNIALLFWLQQCRKGHQMNSRLSLIDQIYEAAVVPSKWAGVCDLLAAEVDSYAASVITIGENQSYRWVTSPHNNDDMALFSENPLRFENVRPPRHLALAPFGFMRDQDLMTDEEIANDPIYNEVMRPRGVGWTVGDIVLEPSGHMIIFDILRQVDRGPFRVEHVARLNALRPDLARAALMSSRLAFRDAENITKAMSAIGLPSAVIGDGGNVVAANSGFEGLVPRLRVGARNRIRLSSAAADSLLQQAITEATKGVQSALQSIPVAAEFDQPALILHILPVRREARDIFSKSAAIIIVTAVGAVGAPDIRVLSGLFDLTPSEARVARMIAGGKSVENIAVEFGISLETVRSHLKKVFLKTGVSRQSELVAMLSGLGTIVK